MAALLFNCVWNVSFSEISSVDGSYRRSGAPVIRVLYACSVLVLSGLLQTAVTAERGCKVRAQMRTTINHVPAAACQYKFFLGRQIKICLVCTYFYMT
jgi:hypothetical protein